MANSGRMTTGTNPRTLQFGLDKIVQHFQNQYLGKGMDLFTSVKAEKGFYEMLQLAGMGLAAPKGEGDVLTYDSIDQDFGARFPVFTYEKSARITMEALEDNLYESWLERIGAELTKAHLYNRDYLQARILNRATVDNGPDSVPLLSTAHPLQAGGTNTNRLSPDLDLSEDAVEQAIILVDNFLNPDGLQSDYYSKKLIVPVALKYVAQRIFASKYRTSTADNDVNAVMDMGELEKVVVWKRLTGATTWFITTDAPNGLIHAEKKGMTTKTFNDPFTYDTIITAHSRFRELFFDHRCIVGTVGP